MNGVSLKLTAVGKNAHVTPGFTIGAGCVPGTDVTAPDFDKFPGKVVPNGTKIGFSTRSG